MARRNPQTSGMHGVFLVAAELAAREFVVSPTSRSAVGADLLVTNQACSKSFSVQVKTNRQNLNFWLVGRKGLEIKSPSHIYVFVNLGKGPPRFYVVPSRVVVRDTMKRTTNKGVWYCYKRDERYAERWKLFGHPQ